MRRFILNEVPDTDGLLRISGKDFRYISRVLRLRVGDSFRVLMPSGAETTACIRSVDLSSLECVVLGTDSIEPTAPEGAEGSLADERAVDEARRAALSPLPPIVLLQALPKGQKMDLIVRQAVETGIALVLPFISERSVARPESGTDAESKRQRWQRIVREARQQSGSAVATEVAPPSFLAGAIDRWLSFSAGMTRPVGILLHQDPLAQGTLHGYLSGGPDVVALAVGPEGGFSTGEAARIISAGFQPLLIGANVLRTETAALFAAAAVQTVLLEKASWMLRTPDFPG